MDKGQQFGRLTVIGLSTIKLANRPAFLCQCSCGNTTNVRATNLSRGVSHSCGCLTVDRIKQSSKEKRLNKGDISGKIKCCSHCKILKPIKDYMPDNSRPDGCYHRCRDCNGKVARAHKYKFMDYDQMFIEQLGRCCICNSLEKVHKSLCVDHDHKTGKVRALLCSSCNRGLGDFKDSSTLLEKAAQYIRTFTRLA